MKPTCAIILSAASLTFQLTVLYPWHIEISEEIKSLHSKINRLPKVY